MIVCAMATFPPRASGAKLVVSALLPQCDKFYVYLNGYDARPDWLPNDPKIQCVLAGPSSVAPDIGSHGKFNWLGRDPEAYYFPVDDDIIYPGDYTAKMVEWMTPHGGRVIATLHGICFRVMEGKPIPHTKRITDIRTMYGYTMRLDQDKAVHLAGTACSVICPSEIGLTTDFILGPVGTGDDEDLAVWAQKKRVPIVRFAGQSNWVRPNNGEWQKDALHRREGFAEASEAKLKAWKMWRLHKLPETPPPPRKVAASPMVHPKPSNIPSGPCFDKIALDEHQRQFCNKILSSDALAAFVLDAIKRRQRCSVIRMADGERAIMQYAQTGAMHDGFLKDEHWLTRYGLKDADLKQVGNDLLWAGERADYLACTISGIFWPSFNTEQFFPNRTQFVDQFFPQLWTATGRVAPLLRAAPVLILHREHAALADDLRFRFPDVDFDGMSLSSWQDQTALIPAVMKHRAHTVLVSGGASGKAFCVRLAEASGKVVLDVGEALGRTWATILPVGKR